MGRRNFAALEGVDIVLSAAMPEEAVFCTRIPKGIRIRMWCCLDEDDMIRALIREFTEISVEEKLKSLGYSPKTFMRNIHFNFISGHLPHILTELS